MSDSRKNHISLYEQETLNKLDAEKQRPVILSKFWLERIENRNDKSIGLIKGFLKRRPPPTRQGEGN